MARRYSRRTSRASSSRGSFRRSGRRTAVRSRRRFGARVRNPGSGRAQTVRVVIQTDPGQGIGASPAGMMPRAVAERMIAGQGSQGKAPGKAQF